MKEKFLKRLIRITKSFNVAFWITTIVLGITSICVIPYISDKYIENENFGLYLFNLCIAALVILIIFMVTLGIVFLIFAIINSIISKYLSNKKKSQ